MALGKVVWFSDIKGFGFIEPETGGKNVIAHFSAIRTPGRKTLREGERVCFDVVSGPKGPLAQNIRLADLQMPAPPGRQQPSRTSADLSN